MAVLLVLSIGWVTANFANTIAFYDGPYCFIAEGAAVTDQNMHKDLLAQGLNPCPPEGTQDHGLNWNVWLAGITLLSALMIPISALALLRNLYQLKRYKNHLADHLAFLQKYNRL